LNLSFIFLILLNLARFSILSSCSLDATSLVADELVPALVLSTSYKSLVSWSSICCLLSSITLSNFLSDSIIWLWMNCWVVSKSRIYF
jgi:hypothetical protein